MAAPSRFSLNSNNDSRRAERIVLSNGQWNFEEDEDEQESREMLLDYSFTKYVDPELKRKTALES